MKLKPGLSGKVEILLDELKGVLAVPQQAVFSQRGKFHVFRREGEGAVRAPVEIEPGNAQYVVIKSGLTENDRILLYDPEAAGGASVAGDKAGEKGREAEAPKDAPKSGGPGGGARGGERPKSKP